MAVVRGKILGSLLGLAVCDAVGTTVEFMPPGSFTPVSGMQGGGKFSLEPGEWTDDTSMALCLCESLIECRGFNPVDQAQRYWRWYDEGHLSSNGECFDIGKTVLLALQKFTRSGGKDPYSGSTGKMAAGNGSLMRLCPIPLLFHKHPHAAMELSAESSRVTHGPPAALDACRYFAGLLVGCLEGASKEELLSPCYSPTAYWQDHPMSPEVEVVARGSFKQLEPPDIVASGYVVKALEAVLWAFYHTSNFEEGCLKVVNLGNDADTVGAIYGQIAGAFYGSEAIPKEWREKCSLSSLIGLFADELSRLSGELVPPEMPFHESTDWSVVNAPLPHDQMSDVYKNIKIIGYDLLESKNREIVRRLNPCPKQYKTLEDFKHDVATLEAEYGALVVEAQDAGIMGDFQRRWRVAEDKMSRRVNRGRV